MVINVIEMVGDEEGFDVDELLVDVINDVSLSSLSSSSSRRKSSSSLLLYLGMV